MIEYGENGWILTDKDKLDVLNGSERVDKITHAPDYPKVDLTGYKKYYFDSLKGSDGNDGLTESTPKKTAKEAERIISSVKSDDKVEISFKKGSLFSGGLVIEKAEPSEEFPLIISSYGEGDGYPVFCGEETVVKVCVQNVRIYGLEVTGPNAIRGIHVFPVKKGAMKNIVLENCYVHDVNFVWNYDKAPKDTCPDEIDVESVCPHFEKDGKTLGRYWYRYHGGIIFHNEFGPSWFENVWVRKNVVKNVARTGMTIYSKWTDKPGVGYGYNKWAGYDADHVDIENGVGYFLHKNIYWNDNYIECAGGDALVVSSAENVFVERNVAYFSNILGRKGYWNGGIWVYNVNNAFYQFNEVGYTWKRHGAEDSEGLDIDNACRDVICQFNYSHHNEGGGILVCNLATNTTLYGSDGEAVRKDENGEPVTEKLTGRWFNNIIRNNIFFQNGTPCDNERSAFMTIARETDGMFVYNNTVVLREDIDGQSIIFTEDKSTFCYNNLFFNNLFVAPKKCGAKFTLDMMKNSRFTNNAFFNIDGEDIGKLDENAIIFKEYPFLKNISEMQAVPRLEDFRITEKASQSKALKAKKYSEKDVLGQTAESPYIGAIAPIITKKDD